MHWFSISIGLVVLIILLTSLVAICTDRLWRRIAKYLLLGAVAIFVLYTYTNTENMQELFKW
jgi:hypothetical protein